MQDCTLLDVGRRPDADRADVATQPTAVPNAGVAADLDVADDRLDRVMTAST